MNGFSASRGDPGQFALVMATGIIALGAHLLQWRVTGWLLLVVALAAWVTLWLVLLWRLAKDGRRLVSTLGDQQCGPGFFAVVAGTCVVGSALVVVASDHVVARALWWLSAVLWLLFLYGYFSGVMTRQAKPPTTSGLHGGWLTVAVATQSLSALGTLLAGGEQGGAGLLFIALLLHLLGNALYVALAAAVTWRLLFLPLAPEKFDGTYWICAGGAAVSSLAAALLVVHAPEAPFLDQLLPILKGGMLSFWAVATAWLPLLTALTVWRVRRTRGARLRYPGAWDAVFPLGMYTVSTFELSQAESSFPLLLAVAHRGLIVTLLAWAWVALAKVRAIRADAVARRRASGGKG